MGLDPRMRRRWEALTAYIQQKYGFTPEMASGFRDAAGQMAAIRSVAARNGIPWSDSLYKTGIPGKAARVGGSRHQKGLAIDIKFKKLSRAQQNAIYRAAPKFGLKFPLPASDRNHVIANLGWKGKLPDVTNAWSRYVSKSPHVNSPVAKEAYSYFLGKGLKPHQAASIAGNMAWESGGRPWEVSPNDNPKYRNSPHSAGIGQWNDRLPNAVKFWRSQGLDLPQANLANASQVRSLMKQVPLKNQLDFAWHEMQNNPYENRAFQMVKNASDVTSANAGAISYHRPRGWSWRNPQGGHKFNSRTFITNEILKQYGTSPVQTQSPVAQLTKEQANLAGDAVFPPPAPLNNAKPVGQVSTPDPKVDPMIARGGNNAVTALEAALGMHRAYMPSTPGPRTTTVKTDAGQPTARNAYSSQQSAQQALREMQQKQAQVAARLPKPGEVNVGPITTPNTADATQRFNQAFQQNKVPDPMLEMPKIAPVNNAQPPKPDPFASRVVNMSPNPPSQRATMDPRIHGGDTPLPQAPPQPTMQMPGTPGSPLGPPNIGQAMTRDVTAALPQLQLPTTPPPLHNPVPAPLPSGGSGIAVASGNTGAAAPTTPSAGPFGNIGKGLGNIAQAFAAQEKQKQQMAAQAQKQHQRMAAQAEQQMAQDEARQKQQMAALAQYGRQKKSAQEMMLEELERRNRERQFGARIV